MNRRRMLELSGLATALGLAGCMGDGGGDGTTTPGTTADGTTGGNGTTNGTTAGEGGYEHVDGQTFRMATDIDPSAFHWFFQTIGQLDFHPSGFNDPGFLSYEHGVWGQWSHNAFIGIGELNYRLFDDVVTEADRMEITVKDDVRWSDGEPMTSRDAIAGVLSARISESLMGLQAVEEQGPNNELDAVTGFELPDDKTAVLLSEGGYFDDLVKQNLWLRLLIDNGPKYPTHIEPYKPYIDRVFEVMEMVQNGEADPWNNPDQYSQRAIQNDVYGDVEQWVDHFSQPENIVVSGAWKPNEILQNEIIFTPNQEHRYYDRINFDEVILEWMQEEHTIWSSLNNGRLDYASQAPPSHLIDEFPDIYENVKVPDDNGHSFHLNHNWPGLHKVMGRQGMLHAINTQELVNVVNPNLFEPITVPGGDVPQLDLYIEEGWAEENLIDYSYDPETATQKMEEAGFSKPNDTWLDENGDPIQLIVHTDTQSPEMENVLASQLRNFGVQCDVRPLEDTQFENAKHGNNLCLWPGNASSGYPSQTTRAYENGWFFQLDANATMWFPEEQIRNTSYNEDTQWGVMPSDQSPEGNQHLTTMAPPIGEPNGELQEYETMYLTRRFANVVGEERREIMKKLLWLVNWHLPAWPVANVFELHFLNTENWIWETQNDQGLWELLGITNRLMFEDMLGWGDQVFADPENPKQ